MTDIQKLKEKTCKELHALLMSGNQAVTKIELERDYKTFIGSYIAFREMGYPNLESFLRDNSQYFKIYWEGPRQLIKHVTNAETDHIQKMINNQKPKTKKKSRGRSLYNRYARPRSQPIKPPPQFVPNVLRGQIRGLLMQYSDGILGSNFDAAYAKKYGNYINFKAMSFVSLLDMLRAMTDIVSIDQESSGMYKIHPKKPGISTNQKPGNIFKKDSPPSRPGNYKNLPPRLRRPYEANHEQQQSRTLAFSVSSGSGDSWDGDNFGSSGVNSTIQKQIQKLLAKHKDGIWANRFQAAYYSEYKQELDFRSQGHNSTISLMAELPHIVTIERASPRDWLLFDARYAKPSSVTPNNKTVDKPDQSSTNNSYNRFNTVPPIDESVKETIRQVVAYHPKGVLLDELTMVYQQLTGAELSPSKMGFTDLEALLVSLDDVIHMEYKQASGKMLLYPQLRETMPTYDKLLNIKPKQITRHIKPKRDLPADVVGPDSGFRLQQVPHNKLEESNYFEVYVSTVINPGNFWLQLKGPSTTDALEDLMDRLETVYCNKSFAKEYQLPEELAKPNQVCAAVYPPEGDWHRCRLLNLRDSDFAELFYVDYGSTHVVTQKSLMFLKWQDFALPAQAIPAKLSNIKSLTGDWSREARDLMLKLVSNRALIALVTDVAADGTLSVCLTDTSGETDIHVNDVLVLKGQAVPDYGQPVEPYLPPPVPEEEQGAEAINTGIRTQISVCSSGNIEGSECEKHIKFILLSHEYSMHIVCHDNKGYVTSGEISNLLWPGKDMLRSMMRQKRMNVNKIVLPKDENGDLFDEFIRYDVGGTCDTDGKLKSHVTLFELVGVPEILDVFEHPDTELKETITQHAKSFDAFDPYWKGQSGESDEDEEYSEDEECIIIGRQTLEDTLQLLQFRRKRILAAMQKEDANTIDLVEKLQLVEKQLQDFKHRLVELDKLEKDKPSCEKFSDQETFIYDVVAEQSDSYLKTNSLDLRKAPTPPGVVPKLPNRAGIKTNTVAPMMTETKTDTSHVEHTAPTPSQTSLGYSLPTSAIIGMNPGAYDPSIVQTGNALIPMMSPMDDHQQMLMTQNQYLFGLLTANAVTNPLLAASMNSAMFGFQGLNRPTTSPVGLVTPINNMTSSTTGPAIPVPQLGSSLTSLEMSASASELAGLGNSMGMMNMNGQTPSLSLQGRGRGMVSYRPPPGGLQKK